MIRYLAWGSSTCAVERGFSKTLKLRGGQAEDKFVTREEDILCLQEDDDPTKHDAIIKAAQGIWSSTYGDVRANPLHTIRTGKQQRQGIGSGEAAFLRIRREATDTAVDSTSVLAPRLFEDVPTLGLKLTSFLLHGS